MPTRIPKDSSLGLKDTLPLAFNASVTPAEDSHLHISAAPSDMTLSEFPFLYIRYEITAPFDLVSGQATGRVKFQPLIIVRARDKVTPVLFSCVVNNRNIPYLCFTSGTERFELTNAHVVSIQYFPTDKEQSANGPFEEIGFGYQDIKITSSNGLVSATGSWSGDRGN